MRLHRGVRVARRTAVPCQRRLPARAWLRVSLLIALAAVAAGAQRARAQAGSAHELWHPDPPEPEREPVPGSIPAADSARATKPRAAPAAKPSAPAGSRAAPRAKPASSSSGTGSSAGAGADAAAAGASADEPLPSSTPKPTAGAPAPNTLAPKTAGAPQSAREPTDSTGPAGAAPELAPPPPPVNPGDFAGRGSGREHVPEEPQDDYDPEAQEERRPDKDHEYSVRFDALNWFLLGRLSIELEMSLFKYLSVTLTPVFVTGESPIAVNYAGLDNPLTQHSNGLGPLSGASIGVGAWFWGEPFRGYVLRLEFTNYGYRYRTADAAGTIDRVDFTERRLILFIGSHSRFGPFTFAGGFGLGYELNQRERCGLSSVDGTLSARDSGCKGHQYIALDRELQERSDLNGPLHPVYFQARFSLGVVF